MDTWPHHQMDPLGPVPLLISTHVLTLLSGVEKQPRSRSLQNTHSWTECYPPVTSICPMQAADPASPGDTKSPEHPRHPGKARLIPREQGSPSVPVCECLLPASCPVAPHTSGFFGAPSGLRNPTPTRLQS